ncbi:MAG: hypothetical protein ABI811_03940 [Acidobacteriota bacterium]
MDQSTLLVIMAGAVCVSAVALVIQAGLLFGMYKATQAVQERVLTVMPKVEELLEVAKSTAQEGRMTIIEIRQKSNQILDTGQRQMKQIESLIGDVSDRTSKQLAYAETIVEDALERVESTVALLHKGVLKPIRGVTGLAAGIGAAIQYLMNRRRNPESATLDEEMYI